MVPGVARGLRLLLLSAPQSDTFAIILLQFRRRIGVGALTILWYAAEKNDQTRSGLTKAKIDLLARFGTAQPLWLGFGPKIFRGRAGIMTCSALPA